MGTFQVIFSSSLQVSGRFLSAECPWPPVPRNCTESSARKEVEASRISAVSSDARRSIVQLRGGVKYRQASLYGASAPRQLQAERPQQQFSADQTNDLTRW